MPHVFSGVKGAVSKLASLRPGAGTMGGSKMGGGRMTPKLGGAKPSAMKRPATPGRGMLGRRMSRGR